MDGWREGGREGWIEGGRKGWMDGLDGWREGVSSAYILVVAKSIMLERSLMSIKNSINGWMDGGREGGSVICVHSRCSKVHNVRKIINVNQK